MSPKITPEHLGRGAIVYVRQSSMSQVVENLESQRRQYGLEETARTLGFASVTSSTTTSAARDPGWWSGPGSSVSSPPYAPGHWEQCFASRPRDWPATAATGTT